MQKHDNLLFSPPATYLTHHPHHTPKPRVLNPLALDLFPIDITSTLYHATLRLSLQFGDDLSMLLLGDCLVQTLYNRRQTRATARLATALTAVSSLVFLF